MTRSQLFENIKQKKSFLCIGLDTDFELIPDCIFDKSDKSHDLEFIHFEFNKHIIDATHHTCVAYKFNTAFYEAYGSAGILSMEFTLDYLQKKHKDIFCIADAKRGDIGNTTNMYAKAFFEEYAFDSITVAPYMGTDSVTPFLKYKDKWVILLALTSNPGAEDFQMLTVDPEAAVQNPKFLYEEVIIKSKEWGNADNMMYVVGATKAEMLKDIRALVPDNFLLIPGVGTQGGSLHNVAKYGMNKQCGLLVNSSRGIIYAGSGEDFADKAKAEAEKLQKEMAQLLDTYL